MTLPASVEYFIIHCGTNNLGHNSPLKIAEGLINIACILMKNYKDLHIFVSCLLPRDDEKSVKRSLLHAVNCYLKELCTDQFHLDSGWTLNNHLNTECFRSDNLHLNTKGCKKLSKLFISKIVSFQITVRRQNLKAPRNYTQAVSFSIVDNQFPPLLSVYQNSSKPVCPVNVCKLLSPVNPSKHTCSFNFSEPVHPVDFSNPICTVDGLRLVRPLNFSKSARPIDFSNPICTVDGLRLVRPLNFSKSARPIDALKLVRSVNFNTIIYPDNSDKPERPVNSSILVHPVNSSNFVLPVNIHTVDSNKPLHPVNSSNVRPVDVCKPIPSVNSNKILRVVNSNKPVNSKNVCLADTRKPVSCQF